MNLLCDCDCVVELLAYKSSTKYFYAFLFNDFRVVGVNSLDASYRAQAPV